MKLKLIWHEPALLRPPQPGEPFIYACDELDRIPLRPGIYVFARRYGANVVPLYVGQALRLRKRIRTQLNNAGLMLGIQEMENGQRLVLIAEYDRSGNQDVRTALNILEKAYIEAALSDGFELLNKQGVKRRVHTIKSFGRTRNHKPFPRLVHQRRK